MKKKDDNYNPILSDDIYWKYEKLLKSYLDFIERNPHIRDNKELFNSSLSHISKKVYEIGVEDGKMIFESSPDIADLVIRSKNKILN